MLADCYIQNARTTFACCALSYLNKYAKARRFGENDERSKQLWLYMLWAKSVMSNTPLSTETDEYKFVTNEFAENVFNKAICYCDVCGCPEPAIPQPPDCSITPGITADIAIDGPDLAATQAAHEVEGYVIFIATNSAGSGNSPNQTATYVSGNWQYATVPDGTIVLDESTGDYWVGHPFPIWPTLLFPSINVNNNGGGNYDMVSEYPSQASGSTRIITVEFSTNGTDWDAVFTGPENDIAVSYALVLPEDAYTQARISYTEGSCTYGPFGGTVVDNNPPSSARSLYSANGVGMEANATTLYNPLGQSFTLSFRYQADLAGPSGFTYFSLQTLSSGLDQFTIEVLPTVSLGNAQVLLNLTGANGQLANFDVTGLNDGQWHHIAVVRNAASIDDWSDVSLYVDGAPYPLSVVNPPVPYGAVLPPENLVWSQFDCWIDEVYSCDRPCTPVEVDTVLRYNTMNTYDSTWGRQYWYRIEDTDTASSIANVVSPPKPNIFVSSTAGSISTNVDPLI